MELKLQLLELEITLKRAQIENIDDEIAHQCDKDVNAQFEK